MLVWVFRGLRLDLMVLAWVRPDLSKAEISRLKKVAERLYETLNRELERIQDFAAKQAARDEIKVIIKDFSCDEKRLAWKL